MYLTRRQYVVLRSIKISTAFASFYHLGQYSLYTGYTNAYTIRALYHLGLIGDFDVHRSIYTITPDGERLLELMPTWLSRRQQGLLRRLQGPYSAYKVANDGFTHQTTCSCRQCRRRLGYWYDELAALLSR